MVMSCAVILRFAARSPALIYGAGLSAGSLAKPPAMRMQEITAAVQGRAGVSQPPA
jgi:hypothetical protein